MWFLRPFFSRCRPSPSSETKGTRARRVFLNPFPQSRAPPHVAGGKGGVRFRGTPKGKWQAWQKSHAVAFWETRPGISSNPNYWHFPPTAQRKGLNARSRRHGVKAVTVFAGEVPFWSPDKTLAFAGSGSPRGHVYCSSSSGSPWMLLVAPQQGPEPRHFGMTL